MAKEKIEIAANPEKIEVKSHHNRRNSTGNFSISNEGIKILPRYLRASFGSCHDFCKYGIEDSLVKKARSRIPKRITERSGVGQDQVKDVILEERKKKLLIKPKALPNYKSSTNDKQGQVTKKEAQVSAKKVAVSSKRFSLPGNPMDVSAELVPDLTGPFSFSKMENASSRRYGRISKSIGVGVLQENTAGGSRTGGNSYINNTSKEMKISNFRKIEDNARPAVSPSSRPSIKRELSKKSGNDKYRKNASLVKSQNGGKQAESKKHIDEYIPEKTLYVIDTKQGNRTENVPDTSHFTQSICPTSEDQKLEFVRDGGILISRSPPSVGNKQMRQSRNGDHTTQLSSPSSLSTYNKGLRRTQNGNRNTRPFSPSSEAMKSDESNPFSGTTIKPTSVGPICLGNEVGSPQKINFRRGKVVDVLSKNTSPQKLSFERRRVLCEKQNEKGDSETRCLKELVGVDKLTCSKTEPMKVVLRHWDVEGKKGGQNLFNNVIEETASKLVQTRKSKVRALVDAFETVIMLQDTKILGNN